MDQGAATVRDLREPASTPEDGTVSRTIHEDDDLRVVLFSFAAGQRLSDHTAAVPVTIEVVEGEGEIGLPDGTVVARAGTWMHLPAGTPHSVMARTPLIVLLTLVARRS